MTATLVELQLQVKVDSIEACQRKGCTLCVNEVQIPGLTEEYGTSINYRGMGTSSQDVMLNSTTPGSGWYDSLTPRRIAPSRRTTRHAPHLTYLWRLTLAFLLRSDAIFVSERLWQNFFDNNFCSWTFIGRHVREYAVAQPVSREDGQLQTILSYWIRRVVDSGAFEEIKNRYVEERPCSPWASGTEGVSAEDNTQPLTPLHCLGAFVIVAITIMVAFLIHHVQRQHWAHAMALYTSRKLELGLKAAAQQAETAKSAGTRRLSMATQRMSMLAPRGGRSSLADGERLSYAVGTTPVEEEGSTVPEMAVLPKGRAHKNSLRHAVTDQSNSRV